MWTWIEQILCSWKGNHSYLATEFHPTGMRGVCLECGYVSPGWNNLHPSKQQRDEAEAAYAEMAEAELRLLGGG